jgi:hypothetical protein
MCIKDTLIEDWISIQVLPLLDTIRGCMFIEYMDKSPWTDNYASSIYLSLSFAVSLDALTWRLIKLLKPRVTLMRGNSGNGCKTILAK